MTKKHIYTDLDYLQYVVSLNGTATIEDLKVAKTMQPRKTGKKLNNKQLYAIANVEEYKENLAQAKAYSNKLGGHINMKIEKNKLLFNNVELDIANISRLIYLSTYIDYNYKSSKANWLHQKEGRKKIALTRQEIQEKLNLTERTYRNFMKDCKDNNIIFEVDNEFYINPEFFIKGDLSGKDCNAGFNEGEYTRLFIDPIRSMYEGTKPRQHKQLSYLFMLIPFLNPNDNILVKDSTQKETSVEDLMDIYDIADILGLSVDRGNASKLRTDLINLTIKIGRIEYCVFAQLRVRYKRGYKEYFAINPMVCYMGHDFKTVKKYHKDYIFGKYMGNANKVDETFNVR